MKMSELEAAVGGLSKPSKMPGLSYGTPAAACKVGSILRAAGKHTVCGSCYAHKGMYVFRNVREAQAKRLEILSSNLPKWQADMTALLRRKYAKKTGPDAVFRWHDSGDIQSLAHLQAIVDIAIALPHIRFWLPSKETKIVRDWLKANELPANLTIRLSAPMIGQVIDHKIPELVYSSVGANQGQACPAPTQGNACGDCRACWDRNVKNIDYHKH